MAQTGYTPILIYSSSTASSAPSAGNLTNSTLGSELAINITDGKLFYKDNGGSVQVIGWKTVPTTAGGTGLTSYSQGDLLYYNTGTTLTALAKNTTATRYLSNTGTSNNPAWAQVDLTNGVTGTLPIGNGGTGQTTYTDGQLLIGNSTGNTLTKATLTAGAGVSITNGSGAITIASSGALTASAPVTATSNYTVAATATYIINNKSGSSLTVTLPTASSFSGRILVIQNYQAQTVISASSNVVPQGGGAAGTAILAASVGDSATLVSDGTNWVMMQYMSYNNLLIE